MREQSSALRTALFLYKLGISTATVPSGIREEGGKMRPKDITRKPTACRFLAIVERTFLKTSRRAQTLLFSLLLIKWLVCHWLFSPLHHCYSAGMSFYQTCSLYGKSICKNNRKRRVISVLWSFSPQDFTFITPSSSKDEYAFRLRCKEYDCTCVELSYKNE